MQDAGRKQLGEVLKQLRQALGLKQEELAAEIHASRSFIAQVETGRMDLPADRFRELASVLLRHAGDLGPFQVDPSLILALRRLTSLVQEAAETPTQQAEFDAYVAFYYTSQALARVPSLLPETEHERASIVIAPLVGLLLQFPDVETSLLLHLITRQQPEEPLRWFYAALLLQALYLGNGALQTITDESDLIAKLVIDGLADAKDDSQQRVVLYEIRQHFIASTSNPHLVEFLSDILDENTDASA